MILNVPLIWLVLTRNVRIHVLKQIHVLEMLNVESHITDHCAIVPQDGVEIHKQCATNVSLIIIFNTILHTN